MVRSRLGLKALVLSGLVLGIMAFASSAAQAETGASWKVNGATVTALLPELEIKEIEKLLGNPLDETKHGVLGLTTKGGTKVEFLCTSLTTPNVKLGGGGTVDLGKVTFHGCITKLNGVTSAPCLPKTAGVNDLITTENAVGLIILHETAAKVIEPLTRLVPDPVPNPENKVLSFIELGEECAIGTKVTVTGQLTLRDSGGATGFKTEAIEHLIEPGPLTELTALSVPATLKGTALVKLTGKEHVGLKWSGLPA